MAQASDYPITTGYGQIPGYPLNNGFHKGVDRIMPANTPVVVNGNKIGLSGSTGASTGNHLHLGKFTQNGTLLDPGTSGFSFKSARVIVVSSDATNGNYVKLLADGYVYIYCHLNKQTCVVGQHLVPPPVDGDTIMITNTDNEFNRWNKTFTQVRGRSATRDEFVNAAVGRSWLSALEIISDNSEADEALSAQTVGQVAIRDDWQGQIEQLIQERVAHRSALAHLTDELASTSTELTDIKLQLAELEKKQPVISDVIEEVSPVPAKDKKPGFWVTFVATLLKKK